ncbi:apolipoprotein N-acyltransferase [Mobilicoccus massiliensis]|uniref:apolipoprotein N-acyltransferase n=1 Tax=Mobilicoccus massiliensis TaxID=1522310 RepID=UPI00058E0A0B|nr:apolipoprotein N-acyltransferase [Mobilicoccus massiliensis]
MLRRLVLAVVGGLSIWLAFPTANVWALAPVGVALLVAVTRTVRTGAAFALGFVGGLAWFVPYVSWTGLHVGAMPWFALAALQAFFVGVFGALISLSHRRTPRRSPVIVAALWSAAEWARASVPFGGFPWGRIAYSQADGPLLHLAAWGGPALLGFAVALVGALGLSVVDAIRSHVPAGRGAAATAMATTVTAAGVPAAVAVIVLLGPLLIPAPTDGPSAQLMAIQGNAPQTGLDFNAERRQILDNHGAVTREAARRIDSGELPRPDLVVWPENASDIDPFVNPDAGRVIDTAVDAVGRPVLVGAVLGGGRSDLTNTSILWLPGVGATDERYDKRALVPFAEYMPYRAFFRAITNKVDLLERDFVPGSVPGIVTVPQQDGSGTIRAGIGICFEVAVDHVMDDVVRGGADLLVIQTNNAMFDRSAESAQQLAISRVRAVEYGRSVVHASNVGISALITPDGEAHQRTELFTPAVVSGALPLRTATTPATTLGVLPDVVLAVIAGWALLLPLRRGGVAARR